MKSIAIVSIIFAGVFGGTTYVDNQTAQYFEEPCMEHAFGLERTGDYYLNPATYKVCKDVVRLPEMTECMGNYYQASPSFYCGI